MRSAQTARTTTIRNTATRREPPQTVETMTSPGNPGEASSSGASRHSAGADGDGLRTMLEQSLDGFVERHDGIARLRALRDERDPLGWSRERLAEMAGLGWLGVVIPERHGGLGLGLQAMSTVLERLGRSLTPEPVLETGLLGTLPLVLGNNPLLAQAWLPKLAAGKANVTLAHHERGARHRRDHVETRARPAPAGSKSEQAFVLDGEKAHVPAGYGAEAYVVSARTALDADAEPGITLFLVPSNADGLHVERQWRMDSRNAARVILDDVRVERDHVLGEVNAGAVLLDAVLDRATIGLCAEMLGGMERAFEITLDYIKDREQFGVAVGSFQALQHRAARMFTELEITRAAVRQAARVVDRHPESGDAIARAASLAKARCNDTYLQIAQEGVQMHGGVGMTDEYDIGLYLKRARVAEQTFGDSAWHRDRWATLGGY